MAKIIEFGSRDIIGGNESQTDCYVGAQDRSLFTITRDWDSLWQEEHFNVRTEEIRKDMNRERIIEFLAVNLTMMVDHGDNYRIFNGAPYHIKRRRSDFEPWLLQWGIQLDKTSPLTPEEFVGFKEIFYRRLESINKYSR